MEVCAACGGDFSYPEQHYRWSPWCRPPPVEDVDAKRRKRRETSASFFKQRLFASITSRVVSAHFNHYVTLEHLSTCVLMIVSTILLVLSFIESEVPESRDTCNHVRGIVREIPSVQSMVAEGQRKYLRVEPIIFKHIPNAKKGGIFFSLTQLVVILLQECAEVRRLAIQSSEEWKTGDLYQKKPKVYKDVTHGSTFRGRKEICGKAAEGESNDLRAVIHGWTDEFTSVDGLGVNAKNHKYGAVLGSFVNLPLYMRHFTDFILLLCLYQAKFAKKHGGLMRLLTGVSEDGEVHHDGLTLAAEVTLGMHGGTIIHLPSDEPGEDTKPWRLRIFLLLFSLDWLAHGDFGPFASSVSARRPCFKCKWTDACPCAYLSPAGAAKVKQHTEVCRGRQLRTHADVMREVKELRAWGGSAAALGVRRTEAGIFHLYFASEHLLRNIVRDPTVDIMHVFLCGISRYLLSFVTDIFIPADFSWAALNARAQRHHMPKGSGKLPYMEPRTKGKKSSHTMRMSAAETMYFALARCAPHAPLAPHAPSAHTYTRTHAQHTLLQH